jgi:hypothetical protein
MPNQKAKIADCGHHRGRDAQKNHHRAEVIRHLHPVNKFDHEGPGVFNAEFVPDFLRRLYAASFFTLHDISLARHQNWIAKQPDAVGFSSKILIPNAESDKPKNRRRKCC